MGKDFTTAIRPALVMTALFAILLGLLYPALITGIGQLLFPHQANGSLAIENGKVIGSEILGQKFAGAGYFHPRPSAAGKDGYDALASGGSNFGPASKALADRVRADVARQRDGGVTGDLPADLVTASGSGLDPDLSPEAAETQAPRIAKARGISLQQVRGLIADATEDSLFGDPHVNVLALNRRLDAEGATKAP